MKWRDEWTGLSCSLEAKAAAREQQRQNDLDNAAEKARRRFEEENPGTRFECDDYAWGDLKKERERDLIRRGKELLDLDYRRKHVADDRKVLVAKREKVVEQGTLEFESRAPTVSMCEARKRRPKQWEKDFYVDPRVL